MWRAGSRAQGEEPEGRGRAQATPPGTRPRLLATGSNQSPSRSRRLCCHLNPSPAGGARVPHVILRARPQGAGQEGHWVKGQPRSPGWSLVPTGLAGPLLPWTGFPLGRRQRAQAGSPGCQPPLGARHPRLASHPVASWHLWRPCRLLGLPWAAGEPRQSVPSSSSSMKPGESAELCPTGQAEAPALVPALQGAGP